MIVERHCGGHYVSLDSFKYWVVFLDGDTDKAFLAVYDDPDSFLHAYLARFYEPGVVTVALSKEAARLAIHCVVCGDPVAGAETVKDFVEPVHVRCKDRW